MSDKDVLSKAEVGALLTGVADGVVATNSGVSASGEVLPFEFKSSYHVSSYCPASLVKIYNKLSRYLQSGLYTLLRKEIDVEVDGIHRHRYDEYLATLHQPVCVHSVAEPTLPGTALVVLDAMLVYGFVDNYFGGLGEPLGEDQGRDLTPAEVQMSGMLLQMILAGMTDVWSEMDEMTFTSQGFETDPKMVTTAAPSESMLVVKLKIDMAGTASDCHIVMPLTMLAPVLAKLEASGQGSLRKRERFQASMRQQLQDVKVTLDGSLCEAPLSLRKMLALSPGDVIPVDLPANIALQVDQVPVLIGRFGKVRGMNAICIAGRAPNHQKETSSNEADS